MDTVLSYFLAMPDWIQLGSLIRRYEKICEALDGYAILGALHSYGIQQKYELQMYLRVLRELAAHGFDEVLCYRVGEEVDVKQGWLPVKGMMSSRSQPSTRAPQHSGGKPQCLK
jgi:hypothetical protein